MHDPAEIAARLAIAEVVHRYCRAVDRMDRPLALSCWHEGGTDDHAPEYAGSAAGFLDWLWPFHAALAYTRHRCSNLHVEVAGARAAAESYCDITLRVRRGGEVYDLLLAGRYLDRFERIDGVWAIRHRTSVTEWSRLQKADLRLRDFDPPLLPAAGPDNGEPGSGARARRDADDPAYALFRELARTPPTRA